MRICFITQRYPGKHNQSDYAFVKQLVDAIAAQGNDCFVACPYNILHYHTWSPVCENYSVGLGKVLVIRPWYFSFSDKNKYLSWIGTKFRQLALMYAFRRLPLKPDVIYGHFWIQAYAGFGYAKKHNIPLFVATGESEIERMFARPNDINIFRDFMRGVICVSSKNRVESIQLGLTTADKCGVFPNAVNHTLFYKRDKDECRKKIGLPHDDFIIAYVGWFIERKGSNRVAAAIEKVGGVKSLFVGKGELEPHCNGILFKGPLAHDQIPLYLSAADIFVLPTQHEGCCNAIVEAMACGLPIVSSNLPFNWDVLDNTNSIMIDPNNVDDIADAIKLLRDNKSLRKQLSEGALQKAKSLTIEKRASAIMSFIKTKM